MSSHTAFAPAQFAEVHKAQLDSLLALANTTLAGFERLAALNLNTTRSLLEESADSARALFAAKDLQDFVAIQSTLTQPAVDKAAAWARSAYDIGAETRTALHQTIESQLAEANQAIDNTLDALVKNAPAGTDATVNASVSAFKSALGAANTAYANLSKTARQVSDYAEASLAPAAKPASKGRKA